MLPPPSDHPEPAAFYLAACSSSDQDDFFDDEAGADGPKRDADDRSTDIDEILWWSPARDTTER
jgi:hypothetical protein